ncbi:apolipoprotein N-acyltransferase [Stieleria sp. TO1_6]|uniref:apolipoprotein N-acyltransferase n=1 Tax=Stieleria tagensis TaxID=2956795 RepID=UPI00209B6925|nr:apolipoprotein N-acyltransferase [Stieleria tagensis]MCO8122378.1 apolipoprotein N-acyltransferase [Stieleria tagensis]
MTHTAPNHTPARPTTPAPTIGRDWWILSVSSAMLLWISGPPLGWWPIAFVAVIPWLVATLPAVVTRKQYLVLYLAGCVYWALTLQGLRHANPLIYPCWIALAAYLAVYPILFVIVLRRTIRWGIPLMTATPLAWVGMECVRNYMLTGISAAMLGHTMADVPLMIQIADLGGSYAVSLVIVAVNVAGFTLAHWCFGRRQKVSIKSLIIDGSVAAGLLVGTLLYGQYRLNQPTEESSTTFALVGRNEPVEYNQDQARELELFDAYTRQSIAAVESSAVTVDAVVWPESMFTGTLPWVIGQADAEIAQENDLTVEEVQSFIDERRRAFQFRAGSLQSLLAKSNGTENVKPELIVGCGVIRYGKQPAFYNGIVHLDRDATVQQWYGKMHLVMFGEYIPLVKSIPIIRDWIPAGLGLTAGDGTREFQVGPTKLCPNVCIETAVERVAINHMRQLRAQSSGAPSGGEGGMPNAIVTVTNDAWFDDSSVVQHHKRCAQFVAIACRRPVLSAANNGPTVWIDSNGRVVKELQQGGAGSVIARPRIDRRISLVMTLADWPARICALLFLGVLIYRPRRAVGTAPDSSATDTSNGP